MSVDVSHAVGGSDRRQFVLGGALIAAAALATALRPHRAFAPIGPGELERAIPARLGSFRYATANGLVVPPENELSRRIYDQVLTRVYVSEDAPSVMLLIAYGSAQDSGLQLHRPESCYPAVGYDIVARDDAPFRLGQDRAIAATYLTAERNDQTEQVFYWTRIGDSFPRTLWQGRRELFRRNLLGSLPDGVLVRISTVSPDRGGSLRLLESFNALLLWSLTGPGRRLLLGTV